MNRRAVSLLAALWLSAGTGQAAALRGVVTGDVTHMPWRKGKAALGWCAVRVWRDGLAGAGTRTGTGKGEFELSNLPEGPVDLEVSRPGFLPHRRKITLTGPGPAPLRVRLQRDPDYGLIVLPRTGTAVTRAVGESFAIECLAPPSARAWSAGLVADRFSRPLKLVSARFAERGVWNAAKDGWRLTVSVPKDSPPEMYHLRVRYQDASGGAHVAMQARAVQVLAAYPQDFLLMPYGDFHFNWLVHKPGAAGEAQGDYFKAASLIGPLWVSLGDDVGFEGDDHYAMFHYLVSRFCRVPVYLAFGNHDAALTAAGHEFHFGPRCQTRRVGPHVAVVLSYDLYQAKYEMPEAQKRFVNAALARFHAEADNRVLFLAGHRSPWPPSKHKPFFTLPFTPAERTTFAGRRDGEVSVEFRRLFLDALSVSSMHGWAGLNYTGRVLRIEGLRRATLLPQAAMPSVELDGPNNGSAEGLTATIRLVGQEPWDPPKELYTSGHFCDLPAVWRGLASIRNARLRLVVRRGATRCTGGRILRCVDGDAGKTTVLYVRVDATQPVTKVRVIRE